MRAMRRCSSYSDSSGATAILIASFRTIANESFPAIISALTTQDSWPVVAFNDGRLLHRPTIAMLADELGISELPDPAQSMTLPLLALDPPVWPPLSTLPRKVSQPLSSKASPERQVGTSSKIENYLSFPTGISGQRLAYRAWVQALKFGVRFAVSREAVAIGLDSDLHKITLEGARSFCSRAVVIATGRSTGCVGSAVSW